MRLYAVVMHCGATLSSGHYTAYVQIPANKNVLLEEKSGEDGEMEGKSVEGEQWLHLDDDTACVLSTAEMESLLKSSESSTPYLLFYA